MPSPRDIFLGFVLPGLITLAGLALAWRFWRRGRGADGRWIGAPIVSVGLILGYCTFAGRPSFPPTDFDQLVVYIACGVIFLGLADARLKPPMWLQIPVVLAMSALAMWLLCRPLAGYTWLWITPPALTIFIWWLALEPLAERTRGVTIPAVSFLTAVGAALLLTSTQNEKLGQVSGALAAVAAAGVLAGLFIQPISWGRGMVLAFSFLLVGLLAAGYVGIEDKPFSTMDDLTRDSMILATAPLLAWAGDLPGIRKTGKLKRLAIRLVAVLVPITVVAVPAVRKIRELMNNG